MTTTPKDGGPAFPHLGLYQGADGNLHPTPTQYEGLSLRDWFAGQAIRARWGDGTAMTPEQAAEMAYQLADAMLTARETDND
jgi:hypothetical protein